ncbi:ATP-binding protein [Massilia sp. METH4]|uniref:sensor histidine kinase n=1 Tax=Massilia sp. METH4 TaxID=3123041 RepID=UPI0030CF2730
MTRHFEHALLCPWPAGPHWDAAWDWALAQMPCPAFRCDEQGAIVFQNAAAERLWGGQPPGDAGRWSGFVALWLPDGTPVEPWASPAALAAGGAEVPPTELLAESLDGESRRVVFHARPLLDNEGRRAGALCALTDVSERRRLESEARAADEDRVVFLSMLAHELRNPLAPIMSAAGAMRKMCGDPIVTRMADIVDRQARQLVRFINDLVSATRLHDAPEVPVVIRDSNVGEVVDLAVDVVAAAARARGQTLSLSVQDRAAPLRCDPERIAQALGNALLNAIEHSPDGARIRLDAQLAGKDFHVRVSDDGAGIEPGRLRQIFEPFKSFDTAVGKANPAGGMGLWVARCVAEAHGGAVHARSRGPGTGTTVVFTLPVGAGASAGR